MTDSKESISHLLSYTGEALAHSKMASHFWADFPVLALGLPGLSPYVHIKVLKVLAIA